MTTSSASTPNNLSDAKCGGPFTIDRVIHNSRRVGITGWIDGVALFNRVLSADALGIWRRWPKERHRLQIPHANQIGFLEPMELALTRFSALLFAPLASLHAAEAVPIVGAIRWDGWYGEGRMVKAVESLLGQRKYHFLLLWFARVISESR